MRPNFALGYSIEPSKRRVLATYHWQPTDFADWQAAIEEVFKDPAYCSDFDFLLDRTGITKPSSTPFIKSLVAYTDRHWRKVAQARWAFVVRDIASFGTGRMGEQLSDYPGSIRIFKTTEDAVTWLDAMRKEGRAPPVTPG